MKIAYTCSYSYPSISGVWTRVENLAKELIKRGHEVHVLSSNIVAGTDDIANPYECYQGIHIHRFPVRVRLTKYQLIFAGREFKNALEKINPDIIDCQTYRHPEGKVAQSYSIKRGIPCFLTTHAPFLPVGVRTKKLSILSKIYDAVIGKKVLKKYDGILRISDWELPYLRALGVDSNSTVHSPNGIPAEFFRAESKEEENNTVLFLGRIEPRKQVHVLIQAFAEVVKVKADVKLKLVGPIENIENYEGKLYSLVKDLSIENSVEFTGPVYDLEKKIEIINACQIYVLPSTWEGFPQSLIEVMSLGKNIIASNCDGNMEVIKDMDTGLLFEIGDFKQLAEKLQFFIENHSEMKAIRDNARSVALKYKWENIAQEVENLYLSKA